MSRNDATIETLLIAGPTASGKSKLALDVARATGGVIVNADSMQVYDGLRLLTARPSDGELAQAPHRLYGHIPPTAAYSVGEWSREAAAVLAELRSAGRLAIVCGGTGLYFKSLLGGLDPMPRIPPDIRETLRARMAEEGPSRLHQELSRVDPQSAARIRPGDPQRITRALEIVAATGAPLRALQTGRGEPIIDPSRAAKVVLTPPRDMLRQRIASRFRLMLDMGALEEVRLLVEIPGIFDGTAGKAIGFLELSEHLRGLATIEEAERRSVARTRQYAKRQDTFFRHQLDESWIRLSECVLADLKDLIDPVKSPEA